MYGVIGIGQRENDAKRLFLGVDFWSKISAVLPHFVEAGFDFRVVVFGVHEDILPGLGRIFLLGGAVMSIMGPMGSAKTKESFFSDEEMGFALLTLLQKLEGEETAAEVGKKMLRRWREREGLTMADRLFMGKWVEFSWETRRRLGTSRLSGIKLDKDTGLVMEDYVLEAVKKELELAALIIASRGV